MCSVKMEISDLPVEVLEHIFSFLSSPADQQVLCSVSWTWKEVVDRMRAYSKAPSFSRFEQNVYVRLPVAGSLNEGHGNEGFGVIVSVDSEILLAGVAIFLPYGEENLSLFMPDQLKARVRLSEHAVSQIGPIGLELVESTLRLSKKLIRFWNSELNCGSVNKTGSRQSFKCMPGPWMGQDSRSRNSRTQILTCNSIHPYPIFFSKSVILRPGVRYLLSLGMWWEQDGEEVSRPVTTIWGFQGVPKIQVPLKNQGSFRWKQVFI